MTKRRRVSAHRKPNSRLPTPAASRRRTVHETIPYVVGAAFVLVLLFALSWGRDGPVGAERNAPGTYSSPTAP